VGQSRVASRRYVADGDASVDVRTAEDIARILKTGDAQKRRAATAMNDRSSRAHAVFSLTLTQTVETLETLETLATPGESPGESRQMRSRLCLVDLGGSEKLSKSRANEGARGAGTVPWAEYYASRARVTEATNINVGLLALKRCVDALHEAQRRRREGIEPPPHVPYSDSKLTELLSDALGGDGKTAVLVACAPEHEHAVETAQSLRFGERCASVETRARVGRDALAGMLALLDAKIGDCEARIERVERWVTTTTTRRDEIDGTDERVVVSKLAGAEGLRVELEAMLAERAFLTNRIADAAGTETRQAAPRGVARAPSPKPERATARGAADEL
jgi:kinesin family protein 5